MGKYEFLYKSHNLQHTITPANTTSVALNISKYTDITTEKSEVENILLLLLLLLLLLFLLRIVEKVAIKVTEITGKVMEGIFDTPKIVINKAIEGSKAFVESMREKIIEFNIVEQACLDLIELKIKRTKKFEESLKKEVVNDKNEINEINILDENLSRENNEILQINIAEKLNGDIKHTQLYTMGKDGNVYTIGKRLSKYGIKGTIIENKEKLISKLEQNIKNEIKNQIVNQIENPYNDNILDSKVNEIFERINDNIKQYINTLQKEQEFKRYEDLVKDIRKKYPVLNDEMIHELARDKVISNPDAINLFDLSETNLINSEATKLKRILNNTVVLLKDPYITLRDVYNLRQYINEYMHDYKTSPTMKEILYEVRNSIDNTFKQIKIDENTTFWDKFKDYAKESEVILEIARLFSLHDEKSIDLATRKLINHMNKDKEFYNAFSQVLNDKTKSKELTESKDLIDKLAGLYTSETYTKSLSGVLGVAGVILSYLTTPLGYIPSMFFILKASPRLRGELLYYLGKAVKLAIWNR